MPHAPKQLSYRGRSYKRADAVGTNALGAAGLAAFDALVKIWLDDGHRELFEKNFAHLPVDVLAMKMADKFGVYVGGLAEEYVPWQQYAQKLKGEKEQ